MITELFGPNTASVAGVDDRCCPVCNSRTFTRVLIEQTLSQHQFSAYTYASRKEPEFMSLRMVECADCGLAYAPRIPTAEMLAIAYGGAAFDSAEEADMAAATYARLINSAVRELDKTKVAVEIGAGTGAFIVHLRRLGFQRVVGFEPSGEALRAAPASVRDALVHAPFSAESMTPNSASFVCCFMTLEHVDDPAGLVECAFRSLVPGGLLALVVHDRRAWLNRLLGRRSPIIDIEHLQLFSPPDIKRLLSSCGFEVRLNHFANTYKLGYWARLLPVPTTARRAIIAALTALRLNKLPIRIPVGNMVVLATKPTKSGVRHDP